MKYQDRGVVGIDIAADEQPVEINPTAPQHLHVFQVSTHFWMPDYLDSLVLVQFAQEKLLTIIIKSIFVS